MTLFTVIAVVFLALVTMFANVAASPVNTIQVRQDQTASTPIPTIMTLQSTLALQTTVPTPIPVTTASVKKEHVDGSGKVGINVSIAIICIFIGGSILGAIYFRCCRGGAKAKKHHHKSRSARRHQTPAYRVRDVETGAHSGAARHYSPDARPYHHRQHPRG